MIGCPIQKREWVVSDWFWYASKSCVEAGLNPAFIFVMDESEEPLNTIIHNQAELFRSNLFLCSIGEEERDDKRVWSSFRFEKMVELRNFLLDGVRRVNPPLFLSLDSDILLNKNVIKNLVETLNEKNCDAVGGKTFMTHSGTMAPSYAKINKNGNLLRNDSAGVFKTDVLMAIKLMTPSAYNINYKFNRHGEDIGWSKNCKEAGLSLFWDGRESSKHVMRKEDLQKVDIRVGY